MTILADRDVVFPVAERQAVYNWLSAPKRLVVLANTGHSVFINDCSAIQQKNRAVIADALGFGPSSIERKLLENGCLSTYAPVRSVWKTWDHLTVAQLNLVFGIDPATASASLEQSYLDATFPGRIARYEVQQ